MRKHKEAKDIRGLVFDIRRFSTHDGPGLRTTVFTNGCPMRCLWCQNPEGLELVRRLYWFENKCIGCGLCIEACPEKAITRSGDSLKEIRIDRELCSRCGSCTAACPAQALAFDSKEITVQEVLDELLKDKKFYGEIGGITLSGGDPFSQNEFTLEILKKCRQHGFNTAVETCLHVQRETLLQFLPYIDLLIADFKVFEANLHKRYTGQDNALIKENFTYLFTEYANRNKPDILVRIPLIPGYTASEENIMGIACFLHSLHSQVKVELINYNPLAQSKYLRLHRKFLYEINPHPYSSEEMEAFYRILSKAGIVNIIRE